nr:TIR domain-containing protein [Deltaproteobacteria bacterium]
MALTTGFENMGAPISEVQAVRGMNASREEIRLQALYAIAFRLREVRQTLRPRLFLSHAKRDGLQAAEGVKRYLDATPGAEPFFDKVNLAPSDHFVEDLAASLKHSAVIVFLTDVYASRYWCRWEALIAKRNHLPMLVVNLLEEGEPTSAPYLGNGPTIRLGDGANLNQLSAIEAEDAHLKAEAAKLDPAARAKSRARRDEIAVERQRLREAFEPSAVRVVAAAMLTVLRTEHDTARTESVRDATPEWSGALVLGRAPELVTLPSPQIEPGKAPLRLLHPDPPLPSYELELIAEHRPDVTIGSVTDALAGRLGKERPLHDRMVAISISDGPDRGAFGMTKRLQEQTWSLLAYHLLKAGARLGYGGDLRAGGYTEQLFDLVCAARDRGDPPPDGAVRSWLGWPLSLTLDDAGMAALPNMIDVERMPMPTGLGLAPMKFIPPTTVQARVSHRGVRGYDPRADPRVEGGD